MVIEMSGLAVHHLTGRMVLVVVMTAGCRGLQSLGRLGDEGMCHYKRAQREFVQHDSHKDL